MVPTDIPKMLPANTHWCTGRPAASACADAHRRPTTQSTPSRARTRRLPEGATHQGGRWGAGVVPADIPAMLTADARRRAGYPAASACVDALRRPPTRSTSLRARAHRRRKDVEHKVEGRGAGVVPAGQQPPTPVNTIGIGAAPACTNTSRHDRSLCERALDAVTKS